MKTTVVYIDGSNLYYGQLRGSVNKWLDLEKFSKKLLSQDHVITTVKYFTSRIINPQRSICNELRRYATFYKNIPAGFCDGCRLPDSSGTSDGRTIHCPAAWMPRGPAGP